MKELMNLDASERATYYTFWTMWSRIERESTSTIRRYMQRTTKTESLLITCSSLPKSRRSRNILNPKSLTIILTLTHQTKMLI